MRPGVTEGGQYRGLCDVAQAHDGKAQRRR